MRRPVLGILHDGSHTLPLQHDGSGIANDEWAWRVILEQPEGFKEVLVKRLVVNVPSFSKEDDMPVVGRKYHMACRGVFRLEDGTGIVDPS